MTPLERWFSRLPNMAMETECHCGSGKPVIYWSPEESSACEDCKHCYSIYIPDAVMYNIGEKFGFPEELKRQIRERIEEERNGG